MRCKKPSTYVNPCCPNAITFPDPPQPCAFGSFYFIITLLASVIIMSSVISLYATTTTSKVCDTKFNPSNLALISNTVSAFNYKDVLGPWGACVKVANIFKRELLLGISATDKYSVIVPAISLGAYTLYAIPINGDPPVVIETGAGGANISAHVLPNGDILFFNDGEVKTFRRSGNTYVQVGPTVTTVIPTFVTLQTLIASSGDKVWFIGSGFPNSYLIGFNIGDYTTPYYQDLVGPYINHRIYIDAFGSPWFSRDTTTIGTVTPGVGPTPLSFSPSTPSAAIWPQQDPVTKKIYAFIQNSSGTSYTELTIVSGVITPSSVPPIVVESDPNWITISTTADGKGHFVSLMQNGVDVKLVTSNLSTQTNISLPFFLTIDANSQVQYVGDDLVYVSSKGESYVFNIATQTLSTAFPFGTIYPLTMNTPQNPNAIGPVP